MPKKTIEEQEAAIPTKVEATELNSQTGDSGYSEVSPKNQDLCAEAIVSLSEGNQAEQALGLIFTVLLAGERLGEIAYLSRMVGDYSAGRTMEAVIKERVNNQDAKPEMTLIPQKYPL